MHCTTRKPDVMLWRIQWHMVTLEIGQNHVTRTHMWVWSAAAFGPPHLDTPPTPTHCTQPHSTCTHNQAKVCFKQVSGSSLVCIPICTFPFWRQFTRKLRRGWTYHTSAERCQCTPLSHVDHTQPHTHTHNHTQYTQSHTTTHNHTQPHTTTYSIHTHMHGNVYIYVHW